ncbi:protein BUNDLE SHEATH DEFECTIVE 2, chloroplastic [Typha latifolia]|uniref:protein BUNDLE SHEATH DEFECTIVE 2, chloroplastic n=1 Tax=Typha latifolia TaxID=4733 RepID=UPI003C2E0F33
MANVVCFSCANPVTSRSAKPSLTPSLPTPSSFNPSSQNQSFHLLSGPSSKFHSLKAKASEGNQTVKRHSILCTDCEGNGAISCTQCKGNGVNSVDHFNGQFKAGAVCWLCRGKREILCGSCNGAGFVGGFMSTIDETAQ